MLKSSIIIGGASDAHKRADADFYPTPAACTVALAEFLVQSGQFSPVLWEPACGDGAICKVLEQKYGAQVYATDLHDRGHGQPGVDFLTAPAKLCVPIITNPPFALAEKFIWRARDFGVPFAMLLKSTYWHAARRRKLFQETAPAFVLPLLWRPNFMPERGSAATLDFSWTYWTAERAAQCVYHPLPKPEDF
jgi:hypothetical protein